MPEINANIVSQKIISSNIFISRDLPKKIELSIESKSKLKISQNEEDKRVLLNIQINVGTQDEELKIELISDVIFELSQIPDDYNEIAERKLVTMASEMLLNSLDEMLVVMGHKKMELAKKVKR
ncbi:MAG: hypothetical protein PHE06_10690 [Lachnospiraceae bacterium]|nr:hypothetical protein [Lachnospiraceae bacterium]MDD3796415.1 hypothetical protein [Lachnospiraceae bacterium]